MGVADRPRVASIRGPLGAVLRRDALAERISVIRDLARDLRFRASSPIPYLTAGELGAIHAEPVTLPPRSWLGPGTQTVDGLIFVASLARRLRSETIFEIGTHRGISAWCLATNESAATVHTLDLPPAVEPALELETGDRANLQPAPERVFAGEPVAARIVQHLGDSARFDFSPWRGSCDLVYVDGAHSEPYVAADTATALELVSPGGAIVWDDYWHRVDGVRRVLDRRTDLELRRVPETRLVAYLSAGARTRLGLT